MGLLPQAVKLVLETVDKPVAIDTADGEALAAALAMHKQVNPDGKPLINSVNGEEASLARVLPLVAEYGTAVIGLCMDDDGIPGTPEKRLAVAKRIVDRAAGHGIPREDILIDCLALTVGADSQAGWITLEAIRMVKEELGVNMTLGASNVSFGLPDREINQRCLPGHGHRARAELPNRGCCQGGPLYPGYRPGSGPRRVRHAIPEGLSQAEESKIDQRFQ